MSHLRTNLRFEDWRAASVHGEYNFSVFAPSDLPFANIVVNHSEDGVITAFGPAAFMTVTGSEELSLTTGRYGDIFVSDSYEIVVEVGYKGVVTFHDVEDADVYLDAGAFADIVGGYNVNVESLAGKYGEGVTMAAQDVGGELIASLTHNAPDTVMLDGIVSAEIDLGKGGDDVAHITPMAPGEGVLAGDLSRIILSGFGPDDLLFLHQPAGAMLMDVTTYGDTVGVLVRSMDEGGHIRTALTEIVGPGSFQPDGKQLDLVGEVMDSRFGDTKVVDYMQKDDSYYFGGYLDYQESSAQSSWGDGGGSFA